MLPCLFRNYIHTVYWLKLRHRCLDYGHTLRPTHQIAAPMNELPHLLTAVDSAGGGLGGWQVHKAKKLSPQRAGFSILTPVCGWGLEQQKHLVLEVGYVTKCCQCMYNKQIVTVQMGIVTEISHILAGKKKNHYLWRLYWVSSFLH